MSQHTPEPISQDRLNAHALEMYAALKTLISYYDKLETKGLFFDDVKAIIAKVEGK